MQEKNLELTCGVAGDLLPSYVDGLTCEETNGAMAAHLAGCARCRRLYEAMGAPADPAVTAAEAAREVDYLRLLRRKKRRLGILAAAVTAAVLLAAALLAALPAYGTGVPAAAEDVRYSAWLDGDGMIRVTGSVTGSDFAFRREETVRDGAAAEIAVWKVCKGLGRFWGRSHIAFEAEFDAAQTEEIYLCGALIWQDGVEVSPRTRRLYETAAPYVGDAPALGRIAMALELPAAAGPFTMELHTAARPYEWTLHFTEPQSEGRAAETDAVMARMAPLLLALVGNLDAVSWTYQDEAGAVQARRVTLQEADAALAAQTAAYNEAHATAWAAAGSVKDYAADPGALEKLIRVTERRQ